LETNNLQQVLANVPLQAGSKGLAAVAGEERNFKADFLIGLHFASVCRAPLIHVTAGVVDTSDFPAACEIFRENVNWAIEAAGRLGISVAIEAINQTAVPNYFIRSLANAHEWTTRCAGLGYILDLYHTAVEGLDPITTIDAYLGSASHIQLAGYPGRHEPVEGLAAVPELRRALCTTLYNGWIGCEYNPATGTVEGLVWRDRIERSIDR
ncbi:hypothetical protein BK648_07640, partial [Pseudomonas poae]